MKKITAVIFLFVLIFTNVSLFAQLKDLSGNWYFEIDFKGIGNIRTIMDCVSDGTVFNAATLPTANGMGSLAKISDGIITANEIKATFVLPTGSFNLEGEFHGDSLTAQLYNKQNNIAGNVNANKTSLLLPLTDYTKIAENIFNSAREHIFNQDFIQTDIWKNFERTVTAVARASNDDIDLLFYFYVNAMKVPVSHLYLLKEPGNQNGNELSDATESSSGIYEIKSYNKNTVYLKISSLAGRPEEIDSVFKIILDLEAQNLILDLRDNTGGSLGAGLRTAEYLAETDRYGGIFLTRRWFDKNKGNKIPVLEDYPGYKSISIANNKEFNELVHNNDALTIRLVPLEKKFTGKLFILINNKTGSTCEPLIAGLRQNKNTTLVGEKSAGKMMQSEKFSIGEGFILTLPTSDFYTPDGIRLEGAGIKPTVEIASDKALDYVLNTLK